MKAIVLRRRGDPEVLTLEEVADPVLGLRDVLVAVEASAVNRTDLLERRGAYQVAPSEGRPTIPGLDFSGRVVALGPEASGVAVGDAVFGLLPGGGYAEQVVTPDRMVLPVPPGFTFAEAAALPEAFFTAWDALMRVGLSLGETVLIHAAASGVGTSAIRLAHHLGARVLATCSGPKVAAVAALGADAVWDYTQGGFTAFVMEATHGHGVDAILDFVGQDYLDQNVESLAVGGRLIIIGTLSGSTAPLNLSRLMTKRAAVMGTALRSRPREEKMRLTQSVRHHVWPLWASGRMRPVMDESFPLARAADAHRRMEANLNIGKITLAVGPDAARVAEAAQ